MPRSTITATDTTESPMSSHSTHSEPRRVKLRIRSVNRIRQNLAQFIGVNVRGGRNDNVCQQTIDRDRCVTAGRKSETHAQRAARGLSGDRGRTQLQVHDHRPPRARQIAARAREIVAGRATRRRARVVPAVPPRCPAADPSRACPASGRSARSRPRRRAPDRSRRRCTRTIRRSRFSGARRRRARGAARAHPASPRAIPGSG